MKGQKSESHRRAAQQRHEPVNQLKRECVSFFSNEKWQQCKNCRAFLRFTSTPTKRSYCRLIMLFVPFLKLLVEYKQGADKDWLKGIPPANKMQYI